MAAANESSGDRQASAKPGEREQAPKPDAPKPRKSPVDEASEESFPASDPPSFTPSHSGSPDDPKDG